MMTARSMTTPLGSKTGSVMRVSMSGSTKKGQRQSDEGTLFIFLISYGLRCL